MPFIEDSPELQGQSSFQPEAGEQTTSPGILESLFRFFLPKTANVVDKLRRGEQPTTGLVAPPFVGPLSGGEAGQAGRELAIARFSPKWLKAGATPFKTGKYIVGQGMEGAMKTKGIVPAEILEKLRNIFGLRFSGLPKPELYENVSGVLEPEAIQTIRTEGAKVVRPFAEKTMDQALTYLDLLKRRTGLGKYGYEAATGAPTAMKPVYQGMQKEVSNVLKQADPAMKYFDALYGKFSKLSEGADYLKRRAWWTIPATIGAGLVYPLINKLTGK